MDNYFDDGLDSSNKSFGGPNNVVNRPFLHPSINSDHM